MLPCAVLLLLVWGCANVEEPTEGIVEQGHVPDEEIWNGQIEVIEKGKLKSIVQAGYIQLFEEKKLTLMDSGVVVDFFNSKGQHTSVLTSLSARIDERVDLFVALGKVKVVSDSGEILRTERLYWDRTNKRIHTDTLAILTTAVDSLHGYDFESDENLSSWTLKNPTGRTFRKTE
jgi:LPS export ABC transporter protein LptC